MKYNSELFNPRFLDWIKIWIRLKFFKFSGLRFKLSIGKDSKCYLWHNGLIYKIYKMGIPDYIVEWTSLFLDGRSYVINVENEHSGKRPILAGVPQGVVISPILFSIFINDIPQKISLIKVFLFFMPSTYPRLLFLKDQVMLKT